MCKDCQSIKELRVHYLAALDSNDVEKEEYYVDQIDFLAKIHNSGLTKKEYLEKIENDYIKEGNHIPEKIRTEVLECIHRHSINKKQVNHFNKYLDFDLHSKLERYGYIGAARLNSIFKK